jgi:hypothetical protein
MMARLPQQSVTLVTLVTLLGLSGCAAPQMVGEAPPGFDPALCRATATGFSRHLTIEELRVCTRFNPTTGQIGLATRGPMFHPASWGQARDIAPTPVTTGRF